MNYSTFVLLQYQVVLRGSEGHRVHGLALLAGHVVVNSWRCRARNRLAFGDHDKQLGLYMPPDTMMNNEHLYILSSWLH